MLLCDLVEFWSSFWDKIYKMPEHAVLGKLVGGPVCRSSDSNYLDQALACSP